MPNFPYTAAQEGAISSNAKVLALVARAGTCKTTTLVGYAKRRRSGRGRVQASTGIQAQLEGGMLIDRITLFGY